MTRSLGVDVGGTFTDVVLWDGTDLATAKVPSTPADQSEGVIAGAGRVTEGAERFLHGTTVATNAILRTWSPLGIPGFPIRVDISTGARYACRRL